MRFVRCWSSLPCTRHSLIRYVWAGLFAGVALLGSGCAGERAPLEGETKVPPAIAPAPPGDRLLRAAAEEWRLAHDTRDHARLEKLYASRVRYQGFWLDRDVVLRFKEADFRRSPSTRREIADVREDHTREDLPALRFRTTTKATNRIVVEETRLSLSCDRRAARDCDGVPCRAGGAPACEIVAEEGEDFLVSLARGRDLAARPGSCPEALAALAASSPDGRTIVGDRPLPLAAIPIALRPEAVTYAVVLLGRDAAPKALYEIDPGTFAMTETLPGDVAQEGDPARREHAKRACGMR